VQSDGCRLTSIERDGYVCRSGKNSNGAEQRHETSICLGASNSRAIAFMRTVLFRMQRTSRRTLVQRTILHCRVL
jgi:hypothetical protein